MRVFNKGRLRNAAAGLALTALFTLVFDVHADASTSNVTPAAASVDDEEDDDPVEGPLQFYLMYAESEACAQLYPELRKDGGEFGKRTTIEMLGPSIYRSGEQFPDEVGKEIAACLRKPVALSKGQCSRLVGLFAMPPDENLTEAQQAKLYFEGKQLRSAGRPMIGACADKTENALRKAFSRNR
jgi:hypothetical protein